MKEENFNFIDIKECNGTAKIEIDNTELKGVSNYKLNRGTDMIELTVTISVPPQNFNFNNNEKEITETTIFLDGKEITTKIKE